MLFKTNNLCHVLFLFCLQGSCLLEMSVTQTDSPNDNTDTIIKETQYDDHLEDYRKKLESKYQPNSQVIDLMDRHIDRLVRQQEIRKEKKVQYEDIVKKHIQDFNQCFENNAEFKTQFDIRFKLSGSMADGTKVGDALEFDYLVVLTPKNSLALKLEHRQLDSTSTNVKSACTVCGVCTDGPVDGKCWMRNNTLSASMVYEQFSTLIKEALPDAKLIQHGPSQSFYCTTDTENLMKVDLSLVLEVDRTEAESCLMKAGSELILPDIEGHQWSDKCYVLCSGGFWKITVCKYEREYIQHSGKCIILHLNLRVMLVKYYTWQLLLHCFKMYSIHCTY